MQLSIIMRTGDASQWRMGRKNWIIFPAKEIITYVSL
jgi:hypothetical protein